MPKDQIDSVEEYTEVLDRLLKTSTPVGCFCLGFTGVLASRAFYPARSVMEQFAACETVEEGGRLFQAQTLASYEGKDANR